MDEPAKIDGTDGRADDIAARKIRVPNSQKIYIIGKPTSDVLIWDEYLLIGVTTDFVVISESNKHYKIK